MLLAQQALENVEAVAPEAFVEADPFVRILERTRFQPAEMGPAHHRPPDKARAFQRLDVLRGGGKRHVERGGKFSDGALSVRKVAQHPAARGIAQSVENGVELSCL